MPKKTVLLVFGIVLLVVGVLGFVNQPVLGIFEVNTLHNIIHILTGGLALFFATQNEPQIELFGKAFTVVYALVALTGFIMPDGNVLGLMHVNTADNLLHILITAFFAYIGFVDIKRKKVAA